MKKYYALIKNWRTIIEHDMDATAQYNIINKGLSSEYLGLSYVDLCHPLTKEEWAEWGITEDTAAFLTTEEFDYLIDYLEQWD